MSMHHRRGATDRLCDLTRKIRRWAIPGSLWEIEDGKMYYTSVVISPDGDIVVKYRKMFPWLPYEAGTTAGDAGWGLRSLFNRH